MRTDASVDVRDAAVPGETYSVRDMDNRSGTATYYRLLIRDDQEAFFTHFFQSDHSPNFDKNQP